MVVAANAQVHRPVGQRLIVEAGVVGDQQLKCAAFFVLLKEYGAVLLIALGGRGQAADQKGRPVYRQLLRPVHQNVDAQVQQLALDGAPLLIHEAALVVARTVVDGGELQQLAAQRKNHVQIAVVRVDHVARYGDQVGAKGRDSLHQLPVPGAKFPVVQVRQDDDADILPAHGFGRI